MDTYAHTHLEIPNVYQKKKGNCPHLAISLFSVTKASVSFFYFSVPGWISCHFRIMYLLFSLLFSFAHEVLRWLKPTGFFFLVQKKTTKKLERSILYGIFFTCGALLLHLLRFFRDMIRHKILFIFLLVSCLRAKKKNRREDYGAPVFFFLAQFLVWIFFSCLLSREYLWNKVCGVTRALLP